MSKALIILKSEFMRRVRFKGFLITTFLGPVILIALFVVIAFVSARAMDGDARTIAVVDETGVLLQRILASSSADNTFVEADSARADVLRGRYDGYLLLPRGLLTDEDRPSYFALEGGGFSLESALENRIERALEEHRMEERNGSPEVLEILNTHVSLQSVKLPAEGEEAGRSYVYGALGGVMGFLIYITMLVYGSVVMYGVIEEKSTRVVEVINSSARPIDLLMGKVLGIGAMGLVQMSLWALLLLAGITISGAIVGMFLDPAALNLSEAATQPELLAAAGITMPSVSIDVFIWFVLYFLGGYLLYASLFAAVGAMVEQQQDTQGLVLPVMLPIILSIVFISPVLESPHSTLAVVLSMIPFTAPVLMVVRLAVTELSLWEVLLSFGLLTGGFLGAIWVSSRIHRAGILMYGKKATFRDLFRWFRYA